MAGLAIFQNIVSYFDSCRMTIALYDFIVLSSSYVTILNYYIHEIILLISVISCGASPNVINISLSYRPITCAAGSFKVLTGQINGNTSMGYIRAEYQNASYA